MKTFQIICIAKANPTYDERDGFGDYVTYRQFRFCQVGANSKEEALAEVARFASSDVSFFAEEVN